MSNTKIDFLYLDEPSMIKAGVTNMHRCVAVMEEVYALMGKGDYVMGGKNHNSHGVKMLFPANPTHARMPKDGPDRRFMAMIGYLGGRFHVAGEKWYGSNRENTKQGLPRSILMTMLNDADTGAPIALMSANLVSAFRTGAIPGVGAKYLARPGSETCALIGAGVISRTCFMALADVCKNLNTVRIYDLFPTSAERLATFIRNKYPQISHVDVVDSIEEAVTGADVINAATSGKIAPRIENQWIKKGAFLSLPASIDLDESLMLHKARRVVDNWKMYEAWAEECQPPYGDSVGLIGGTYLDLIDADKLTVAQIENLGTIVAGLSEGRKNDDEIILFGMGGLPIYDVAWSYEMLLSAREKGLGVKLNLWDTPYLY
ncbi:MAG: tyramine oxidase subunit B [Candidatus Fimivivens sp.]